MKNLLMALLCCLTLAAYAQKTWNPIVASGGQYLWSNSNNWSPTGVPSSMDKVTVSHATRFPLVSGVANCNSLTISTGPSGSPQVPVLM